MKVALSRTADQSNSLHRAVDLTRLSTKAVRDILERHPTRIIWSQKALARALAAQLVGGGDRRAIARMHEWLKTTGRRRLADCLLQDPVSGYVQGLVDPARRAACLPRGKSE